MEYLIHIATFSALFAILAISLDLVIGYTGMLSVAHAAFYGIGAYTTALLLKTAGLGFFVATGGGIVLAMIAALLIGIVLARFRTDYYALASLGFGVIVYTIFLNWQEVTRGPLGIPGISRPEIFGATLSDNAAFLVLVVVVLLCVYAIAYFVTHSSFGRVLTAIREDEEAISVFGYHTPSYKFIVFVLAAGMAAIAGSLYASYITYIAPSSFSIHESIFVLAIVILGGAGSLRGPLIGAIVLVLLPELLRFVGLPSDIAAQMRQLIYGVVLIFLMLYRPQGLLGRYKL